MAIARHPTVVIDCADADALAHFYAALLDWRIDPQDGWIDVRAEDGRRLSFQSVEDYRPPCWPGQERPQQMHLDVVVDDLDEAEAAVLALGATKHQIQPGMTFRVFDDLAGHPFCLCLS
ncbi:VOC family protein [Nocardioides sp. GXZ039]|uniref:VOC family protein n=1 Tax=Nocardioides sp. GXZ039 TaxID=3136018 RepID=UPI0030F3DF57